MSEEKELQETGFSEMEADDIEGLVDFADLSDLENLSDMDVFGELGDVSDLGDIPDLSEPGDMPDIPVEGEAADLMSNLAADTVSEAEMPDLFPDDMPGESAVEDLAVGEMPNLSVDDMPGEDALGDLNMGDTPEDLPELSVDDMLGEDALGDLNMGDTPEDLPELSVDDMLGEDALGDLDMGDMSEELSDISMDELTGGGDMADSTSDSLGIEEPGANELSGGLAMDEPAAADAMPDMALDGMNISEDGLLENLDIDFGALEEADAQNTSGDADLGDMLDGFLDDMDTNASAEENPAQEGAQGEIADLLGLDDSFFGGEGENAPAGDDSSLDMLDASDMMPEETVEAEKQPGFFKRVFGNIVTDEIAEQEREAAKLAEEEAEKQAEEDAKAKEEKEAQKAEKKAEKEAKAAEKKKAKEALKAEKAKQKAEKKAKEEEEAAAELEIVGKLNKVGVCIIAIATILFLTVEIAGTNLFGYNSAKREALNYFEMGKYTEAYQSAIGTGMQEKDTEDYDRIKTVMKVQQCLNAYQNYDRIQYYPEALDALLRGVKRYDANIDQATQLEVEKDMMSCRTQIISLLQSEFNMTEARAYSLLALDKDTYQSEVIKIGVEKLR